jgi:hypothetical protein
MSAAARQGPALLSSSSDDDTQPPIAAPTAQRRCGKAPRTRRVAQLHTKVLEARIAALEAELALERALRADVEAPRQRMKCPLTLADVSALACPVAVGRHIVSGPEFAAAVAHDNPNWTPENNAVIKVRDFHSPTEYATLGFAVSVVTEAQQQMYGARKTPLRGGERSAADLVMRLLKRQRAAALFRDSDTEYESDISAF